MERLHDSDLRLLLSLIENAIMPEGPAQRERIRSAVAKEQNEREFPYESPPLARRGLDETGHERN